MLGWDCSDGLEAPTFQTAVAQMPQQPAWPVQPADLIPSASLSPRLPAT